MDLNSNNYNYQELWESFAQSQIIQEKGTSKQVLNLSKKWINTVPKDKSSLKASDDFF